MICSGTKAKVESYIEGVLSGDLVTCKLTQLAVERHVRDLERQGEDDFPYYFNESHATVACDFFPLMLRHSIGTHAGQPFELEPWQAFGRWCLYGWKRDADDSRRFRAFYRSVARKNGKSTEAAGDAIFLGMFDVNPVTGRPEDVAEVILSATKREQSEKVIFAEIERMRLRSKHIEQESTVAYRQVTFKRNKGSIRCVGSDKPYDGLNPHGVVKDELHAWKEQHRKFYDTMQTGSGARLQPMNGSVTTAGDDKSHIWLEEYKYAKGVLEGTIEDESVFAYIFELDEDDDPLDEENWIKANPNLGVSVKLDYLREQASKAKGSPLALNRFTRYHGNRLVTSTEKAFDMAQWDACEGELSDWSEADAVGAGVDLGSRDDLAAYGLCARFPIDERDGQPVYRYEVRTQAYIADSTKRKLDQQPWANWVYNGRLQVCKYPIADLKDDLVTECLEHGPHAVAYDAYGAQQFGDDLLAEGITAASFRQNTTHFNEPILDFLKAIEDGRVTHNGDPLLRWCVANAIAFTSKQGWVMFDKANSSDKIDPVVAMVMAFRMACKAPERAKGALYL